MDIETRFRLEKAIGNHADDVVVSVRVGDLRVAVLAEDALDEAYDEGYKAGSQIGYAQGLVANTSGL